MIRPSLSLRRWPTRRLLQGVLFGTRPRSVIWPRRRLALSAERGFAFWHAIALILSGWAEVQRGRAGEGVAAVERGLAAYWATARARMSAPLLSPSLPRCVEAPAPPPMGSPRSTKAWCWRRRRSTAATGPSSGVSRASCCWRRSRPMPCSSRSAGRRQARSAGDVVRPAVAGGRAMPPASAGRRCEVAEAKSLELRAARQPRSGMANPGTHRGGSRAARRQLRVRPVRAPVVPRPGRRQASARRAHALKISTNLP